MIKRIARPLLGIGLIAAGFFLACKLFHVFSFSNRGQVICSLVFAVVCYATAICPWRLLSRSHPLLRVGISAIISMVFGLLIVSAIYVIDTINDLPTPPEAIARTSYGFQTTQQKIDFLTKHVKTHSTIQDAEYALHISPFPFPILPTQYALHVAVKVAPQDVDRWLGTDYQRITMNEVKEFDSSIDRVGSTRKLTEEEQGASGFCAVPNLDRQTWRHTSPAECYKDGTYSFMVIYRKEGIIIYTSHSD